MCRFILYPMVKIRIILTSHAGQRMVDRDVQMSQIRHVILHPMRIISGSDKRYRCYGIPKNVPYPSQSYLFVIYAKRDTNIKVISVMWCDKGGLIANGFNDV